MKELYDAQVSGIDLIEGKIGKFAGKFTADSRLAFFATGPHSGGSILSLGLWIMTSEQASEMILVHYGSIFDGTKTSKDFLTLTLNEGIPNLYTSVKKRLIPLDFHGGLNDGKWHHIAISMPRKSCLLSDIIMFVDGKKIDTAAEKDSHIFYGTSGRMSIGGFGYSSKNYEDMFPRVTPFIGLIDEFQFWSRKIDNADLPTIKTAKTVIFQNRRECAKDGTEDELSLSLRKCSKKCLRKANCLGLEWSKIDGQFKCFLFNKTPELGPKRKRTKCGSIQHL